MYESQFNQFHGWYTAQAMARSGFMRHQRGHAPSAPAELVQLRLKAEPTMIVEPPPGVVLAPGQSLEQWLYEHQSEVVPEPAARRSWNRMFQDEARVEFGYRKVGDRFIAETQLASLIREILGPDTTLERHHRPPWLEGLELDIWLPTLAIGIEYQGLQHYKAVSAWGGERALRDLQARDARKSELCSKHGVALIEIAYTEPLTRRHVGARLAEHLQGGAEPKELDYEN
jgi:hypothetical protein